MRLGGELAVAVAVAVDVGGEVAVAVAVDAGDEVAVAVDVGVAVAVAVDVGVDVAVGIGVAVAADVGVAVDVGVPVGVGADGGDIGAEVSGDVESAVLVPSSNGPASVAAPLSIGSQAAATAEPRTSSPKQ